MMTVTHRSQRSTASERREAILQAAIAEFARNGYVGGSTEAISKAAGISHPYVFKLFGTKRALFLAVYDRVWCDIDAAMEAAMVNNPDDPIGAMSVAFSDMCKCREYMQVTLQAYAAAADPEIRTAIRERETEAFAEMLRRTGASHAEVRRLFADGYLEIIGTALDLPSYMQSSQSTFHQP
jgi:AcrR family transcriptional regulator